MAGLNLADDGLKRAVEFLFIANVGIAITPGSTIGCNRIKTAGVIVVAITNHVGTDILIQESKCRLLKALVKTLVSLFNGYLLA